MITTPKTDKPRFPILLSNASTLERRTVVNKKAKTKKKNVLKYYTDVDTQITSQNQSNTQHLLSIKFKLGITRNQILQEIQSEPNVANVFNELIRDSYIAERACGGSVAKPTDHSTGAPASPVS